MAQPDSKPGQGGQDGTPATRTDRVSYDQAVDMLARGEPIEMQFNDPKMLMEGLLALTKPGLTLTPGKDFQAKFGEDLISVVASGDVQGSYHGVPGTAKLFDLQFTTVYTTADRTQQGPDTITVQYAGGAYMVNSLPEKARNLINLYMADPVGSATTTFNEDPKMRAAGRSAVISAGVLDGVGHLRMRSEPKPAGQPAPIRRS